jgi:hypothetical protein
MFTAVVVFILLEIFFNLVLSLNEAHFKAVAECVAMNAKANATVCLV